MLTLFATRSIAAPPDADNAQMAIQCFELSATVASAPGSGRSHIRDTRSSLIVRAKAGTCWRSLGHMVAPHSERACPHATNLPLQSLHFAISNARQQITFGRHPHQGHGTRESLSHTRGREDTYARHLLRWRDRQLSQPGSRYPIPNSCSLKKHLCS